MKLLKWMKQPKKIKKPNNQTDLEKVGIWSQSLATNPRIFLDLLVKGENMSLLDVQHIKKSTKPAFKERKSKP